MGKQQKQKETNNNQSTLNNFIFKKNNKQAYNPDLSKKDSRVQQKKEQKQQKIFYNVQFYLNKRKSQPSGDYIDNIHQKWWKNYNLLQKHHGFIQWLFPNNFTSRFNSQAFALTSQQQKQFRSNIKVSTRYVRSYQMILQFYGMKLKNKITGQITQQRNYKQRYFHTLLTSFHNHMRITRILCSLNLIGFGRYAKKLSQFLHQQIHTQKGNLKQLAKYNVDKDWKEYLKYIQTKQDLNIYLKQADKNHNSKQKQQQLNKILANNQIKYEQNKNQLKIKQTSKQKQKKEIHE